MSRLALAPTMDCLSFDSPVLGPVTAGSPWQSTMFDSDFPSIELPVPTSPDSRGTIMCGNIVCAGCRELMSLVFSSLTLQVLCTS